RFSRDWSSDVCSSDLDNTAFFINPQQQLQTKASDDAGIVSLSTENTLALNAEWEFYVQLDFDPSAQNQLRIYLISDKEDLKGARSEERRVGKEWRTGG